MTIRSLTRNVALFGLLACGSLTGCAKDGGVLLLTVDSTQTVSVTTISLAVTAKGKTRTFTPTIKGGTIPPAIDFAIRFPDSSLGPVMVTVTAGGLTASKSGVVTAGDTTNLQLTLGGDAPDLATPDLAGTDASPNDLTDTVVDLAVPAPDLTLVCGPGLEASDTGCVDIDGCAGDPCYPGVTCFDVAAPNSGFTCGSCPAGREGDGKTCNDINGCAGDPCYPGVTCSDVAAPGTGFTCGKCPSGYSGNGIFCTFGCNNNNECDDGNPCTSDFCCTFSGCGTMNRCTNSGSVFNHCDDGDPLNAEACDSSGMCIQTAKCDDKIACTTGTYQTASNTCTWTTSGCTCADYYIEAENAAMVFRGPDATWSEAFGSAHGGGMLQFGGAGASVETWVLGTGVIVGVEVGPNAGTFKVSIDGGAEIPVDTYAAGFSLTQKTIATGLPFGIHHVLLTTTSMDSGKPYMYLDYFRPACN